MQKRLLSALSTNHPFQSFKAAIETSRELRQTWFAYKDQWQENYVAECLRLLHKSKE